VRLALRGIKIVRHALKHAEVVASGGAIEMRIGGGCPVYIAEGHQYS
jgi:hypothetical protein